MKVIIVICAYFIASALLGGLLAYPVSLLINAEFDRIASRCIVFTAVVLLVAAVKYLGSGNYSDIPNKQTPATSFKLLLSGWIIGFGMLIPIGWIQLATGYRYPEPELQTFLVHLLNVMLPGLISGLIIALIEEYIFRGFIFQQIRRTHGALIGLLISSILYSTLHFLKAPEEVITREAHWFSGINIALESVLQLSQITHNLDAFIALFLAGAFLCLLRMQTQSIIADIGVHAGWVTFIKTLKPLTDRNIDTPYAQWLASDYDNFTGHLASIILIVVSLLLIRRNTLMRVAASQEKNGARKITP